MGSGTNRKWWREQGSRRTRKMMTKTTDPKGAPSRLRIKAARAEAARRSNR